MLASPRGRGGKTVGFDGEGKNQSPLSHLTMTAPPKGEPRERADMESAPTNTVLNAAHHCRGRRPDVPFVNYRCINCVTVGQGLAPAVFILAKIYNLSCLRRHTFLLA